MEITLNKQNIEAILQDYAFNTFANLFGVAKKEELFLDIDCSYSAIDKVTITKKQQEEKTESEE